MDTHKLQLLAMQSDFHKDVNTIIDIIAPIVCGKKITKREIDKANKALIDKFGDFHAYTTEPYKSEGEVKVYSPHYTVSLQADYGSKKLRIYKHKRSLQGEHTHYMHESDRSIYLENDGTIAHEVLQKYKFDKKYMPTEKQIVSAEKEYKELEDKIKKLEDKKSGLPFHYYFNK